MRKIILIAAVLIFAVSAGAYVYFFQPFARKTTMTDVLPGDTLGLVRVYDLKKQVEDFKAGRMGRALAGMDVPKLLEAMELTPERRGDIIQGLDTIKSTVESSWFDVLFGQDIAIALLNGDYAVKFQNPDDLKALEEALVLVARPRQPTRVLESLNAMFRTQLSVQDQAYGQWKISEARLGNGHSFFYALDRGLMIAGLSARPVQKCLDQSLNPGASLTQSKAFGLYCARLMKPDGIEQLAFVDVAKGISLVNRLVDLNMGDENAAAAVKTQLQNLRGIQTISMAHYDDGAPLVRSKTVVGIDPNEMSPFLKQATGIEPQVNPTLKRTPKNTLLYSWQNTLDLKFYWQEFQQSPGVTPDDIQTAKAAVAAQTGMALESLLDAFGTQAGLLVNDVNMTGMFPIPELALFIEVTNPALVDNLIQSEVAKFNLPLMQESYNGTDLHYVALPLGDALSPAYAFSEGFCTVAMNRNLLKAMLDAPNNTHLGDNPGFQSLDQGLTDANNSVFYMDTQKLFAVAHELIVRSFSWMAMTRPDKLPKAKQIAELGIYPLLDGMGVVQAVAGRTYVGEDRISSDIFTRLDRQ